MGSAQFLLGTQPIFFRGTALAPTFLPIGMCQARNCIIRRRSTIFDYRNRESRFGSLRRSRLSVYFTGDGSIRRAVDGRLAGRRAPDTTGLEPVSRFLAMYGHSPLDFTSPYSTRHCVEFR